MEKLIPAWHEIDDAAEERDPPPQPGFTKPRLLSLKKKHHKSEK